MSFLADLGMNAANSFVGKAIDFGVGELTANLNLRRQRKLMRESDAYQRQLIKDLPSLNRTAMQNAGMSTSMLDGAFQSAASNGAATSPAASNAVGSGLDTSFATSVLSNKNIKKQNALIDEQIKSVQEDVKTKELQNRSLKLDVDDKEKTMEYRGLKFRENHFEEPQDGDVVVSSSPVVNYMSRERYRLLDGIEENEYSSENKEQILRQNKAIFDNEILTSQILSKDVMNAFRDMPLYQFKQLSESVDKLKNDNNFFKAVRHYREEVERLSPKAALFSLISTMNDAEGKRLANQLNAALQPYIIANAKSQSNSDLKVILEKFLSGKGDWKDIVRLLFPLVNNMFTSFGPGLANPEGIKTMLGVVK